MKHKLQFTEEFKRGYRKLSKSERKAIIQALHHLRTNPSYPSLGAKKMQKFKGRWEARASRDIRILFLVDGQVITLLVCGHHSVESR